MILATEWGGFSPWVGEGGHLRRQEGSDVIGTGVRACATTRGAGQRLANQEMLLDIENFDMAICAEGNPSGGGMRSVPSAPTLQCGQSSSSSSSSSDSGQGHVAPLGGPTAAGPAAAEGACDSTTPPADKGDRTVRAG